MSDKNPYYSIPKALGEPSVEIDMLPPSPELSAMIELREKMERQIWEAFCPPARRRQTALACRGGAFVSLEVGDDGKVIEPPKPCPKCGPVLLCAEHMAMVT